MTTAKKDEKRKGRVVKAALVQVKLDSGTTVHVAKGVELPEDTSKESIEHLDSLGFLDDDE